MKTAKGVNEFTPDTMINVAGDDWLEVRLTAGEDYKEYKALSEIAEYDNRRFYKMSFTSDGHKALYREAKNRRYDERFVY